MMLLRTMILPRATARCAVARYSSSLSFPKKPRHFFHSINSLNREDYGLFTDETALQEEESPTLRFEIPRRVRQKIVSPQDAVSFVRDNDTVSVSGFVCQGVPEAVLKALGERYEETGSPNELTLVFGGGPGDWDSRGLNNFAKTGKEKPMLKRTIGSHYGQTPKVAELALSNTVEAWTMPLGSISRMLRAQSTHSPGHITSVGIGTYVDPDISGGAANEAARDSSFEPVKKFNIDGQENLMYRALPINVAIIRGTTADAQGNITIEQESLMCDQMIIAAAARNSGGIVIAQVKRVAANGSLNSKNIAVPGPLVDCVVVVDEKDHDELHPMSFVERHNPSLVGEIRTPQDQVAKMPLDIRKVIARRASYALKPDTIVNLGIGLPEGVASIAAEEDMLQYITLSTEPGVFGGLPSSGHSFGPAVNASALIEMNQMFDFYDGGGLDNCFLGAAQISKSGDVNVSRMAKNRLTGPGGFIDISQSTGKICFMSPFTAKGLEISLPGDGTIKIEHEGSVKKLVSDVFEKTFSGDEAVRRGQEVYYVTERAVFRRTAKHDVLELIEIAPGIDMQKDILDQMDFVPVISPKLKVMDERIFTDGKMNLISEMFGSLLERCSYHEDDHVLYLDLFGITLDNEDDINWYFGRLRDILEPLFQAKGPIDMVINFEGFDINKNLEESFIENMNKLQSQYYKSVKRFAGGAFHRAQLGKRINVNDWDPEEVYNEFDVSGDGKVSLEELRQGMEDMFQIHLTPDQLSKFQRSPDDPFVDREAFSNAVETLLKKAG